MLYTYVHCIWIIYDTEDFEDLVFCIFVSVIVYLVFELIISI